MFRTKIAYQTTKDFDDVEGKEVVSSREYEVTITSDSYAVAEGILYNLGDYIEEHSNGKYDICRCSDGSEGIADKKGLYTAIDYISLDMNDEVVGQKEEITELYKEWKAQFNIDEVLTELEEEEKTEKKIYTTNNDTVEENVEVVEALTSTIYGYARVSTKKQGKDGNSLENQIKALKDNGATKIYKDSFTGTKSDRPEFTKLLAELKDGDTLIVTKLDRFARSMSQGCELVTELINKGIKVYILNIGVMDNTPSSKLIRNIFFAFAEFERDMIVERTQEGKAIARENGIRVDGRPKKFNNSQLDNALAMLQCNGGEKSYNEVAELLNISKSTLIREQRKRKAEQLKNDTDTIDTTTENKEDAKAPNQKAIEKKLKENNMKLSSYNKKIDKLDKYFIDRVVNNIPFKNDIEVELNNKKYIVDVEFVEGGVNLDIMTRNAFNKKYNYNY